MENSLYSEAIAYLESIKLTPAAGYVELKDGVLTFYNPFGGQEIKYDPNKKGDPIRNDERILENRSLSFALSNTPTIEGVKHKLDKFYANLIIWRKFLTKKYPKSDNITADLDAFLKNAFPIKEHEYTYPPRTKAQEFNDFLIGGRIFNKIKIEKNDNSSYEYYGNKFSFAYLKFLFSHSKNPTRIAYISQDYVTLLIKRFGWKAVKVLFTNEVGLISLIIGIWGATPLSNILPKIIGRVIVKKY